MRGRQEEGKDNMERMITIRVQSKDGTKRLQAHPNQQLGDILGQVRPHNHLIIIINIIIFLFFNFSQIRSLFSLKDTQIIHLFRSPGHKNAITSAYVNIQLHNIPIQ